MSSRPLAVRMFPFYALLPTVVQRLFNAVLGGVGVWLLSMVSIPPVLEAEFPLLLVGGILVVLGSIGVVAPDRLVPRDIGEQS